jgi:hypothetical protein
MKILIKVKDFIQFIKTLIFFKILIKVKDFFQMCLRSRPANKSFQTGLFHLNLSFFFDLVDLVYFGLPWL